MHLKTSPTRNSLPIHHATSNLIKKIRFSDDEDDILCKEKEKDKRHSYGNERIVKPSQTIAERYSVGSTKGIRDHADYFKQKIKDSTVGSSHIGQFRRCKMNGDKPGLAKTPRYTPGKAFATPRKQEEPTKTIHSVSNREMVFFLSLWQNLDS